MQPHTGTPGSNVPPANNGVVVFNIDGPVFFGAAEKLERTLAHIQRPATTLILRMGNVPFVDATGIFAIEEIISDFKRHGATVLLAPEHGLGAVRAHVMIKVGPKEARAVTGALRAIAQVRVLHSVSGEVDLIAVAATASVAEMDQVIDRIGALEGVERTTSSIILSTKFER